MSDNFIENNKYNQLSFDTLQVLEMVTHIVVDKQNRFQHECTNNSNKNFVILFTVTYQIRE